MGICEGFLFLLLLRLASLFFVFVFRFNLRLRLSIRFLSKTIPCLSCACVSVAILTDVVSKADSSCSDPAETKLLCECILVKSQVVSQWYSGRFDVFLR